jgi:hypothetical protein
MAVRGPSKGSRIGDEVAKVHLVKQIEWLAVCEEAAVAVFQEGMWD